MSGSFMLLLPVAVGVIVGISLGLMPRRRRLVEIDERAFPHLVRLRRANMIARFAGIVVGVLIIAMLAGAGQFGMGLLLSPAVFAGTQILASLLADILTRNTARTPGIAGVEVRRVRAYLPTRLTALIASAAALLALALTWTTAVATADDQGNPGRALTYFYDCDGVCSRGASPWPGSFYTAPLALVLAIVLGLAVLAIHITVRRPRNASDPEIVRVDNVVRARSGESVVAAVGIAFAGALFCVSFLVATAVGNPANDVPGIWRIAGWSAAVMAVASLSLTLWCVVVLLLPGAKARTSDTVVRAARSEAA